MRLWGPPTIGVREACRSGSFEGWSLSVEQPTEGNRLLDVAIPLLWYRYMNPDNLIDSYNAFVSEVKR